MSGILRYLTLTDDSSVLLTLTLLHEVNENVNLAIDVFFNCIDPIVDLITLLLDRRVKMGTEVALLNIALLAVLVDGVLQLVTFVAKAVSHKLGLALNDACESSNGAVPLVTLIFV